MPENLNKYSLNLTEIQKMPGNRKSGIDENALLR